MYTTMHCVALRTVRYADRRAILTAWSAEAGRVAFAIPDGPGREAARRRALLMPLSLFEGEASVKPGREVHTIRDLRPSAVLHGLTDDPAKGLVAMFLAEVLEKVLREEQPDGLLSEFIFAAVRRLNDTTSACAVANFPIVFLYHLGHFLGIEPDAGDWLPGTSFDMAGATFNPGLRPSDTTLTPPEAAIIPRLAHLDFDSAERLHLPRALRRRILADLLRFYTLHHTPLDSLNSLSVVSEIF